MSKPVLHSLLKKQLEKSNLKVDDSKYASFLEMISASYKSYDGYCSQCRRCYF